MLCKVCKEAGKEASADSAVRLRLCLVEYHANIVDSMQVKYGKRFLKQPRVYRWCFSNVFVQTVSLWYCSLRGKELL